MTGSLASPRGHHISYRLSTIRADARFLGKQSRALRLRLLHPVAAVVSSILCFVGALGIFREGRPLAVELILCGTLMAQIALGAINVILLAPIWLQMLHLLVAEVFWILLVVASADLLFADQCLSVPHAQNTKKRAHLGSCTSISKLEREHRFSLGREICGADLPRASHCGANLLFAVISF